MRVVGLMVIRFVSVLVFLKKSVVGLRYLITSITEFAVHYGYGQMLV
jgi:hypothetical protein